MRGIGGGIVTAESSVGPAQPYQGGNGVAVGVGVIVGVSVAVGVKTIVGVGVCSEGRNGVAVGGARGSAVTIGIFIGNIWGMLIPVGTLHERMAKRIKAISQTCLGGILLLFSTFRSLIGLTPNKQSVFPPCLSGIWYSLVPKMQELRQRIEGAGMALGIGGLTLGRGFALLRG
jgi:hypothetical protein